MGYKVREIGAESKFSQELSFEVLERVVSVEQIKAVLEREGRVERRERKLNMTLTVLLLIMMHIHSNVGLGEVIRKACRGLRYIWPDAEYKVVGASALSYRRYQLGARPMAELFRQVCQPMATAATPGAFLFGLRLMALDGTIEDVPDTTANAARFGRMAGKPGESAFPQVQAVYLVECGTHAIVDAGFWSCHTSERIGGSRLLRGLGPEMLVMWDRGFHGFDMLVQAHATGAEVLARLPANVRTKVVQTCEDGSFCTYLAPASRTRQRRGERILVRIIQYTIQDPALPGYGQTYRLVTTLLDAKRYPAHTLACAYHERWEIELVIDEIDTHQRLAGRPLRSLKPVGVIQELYALLIAHYMIRSLMLQAAQSQALDPDRISFVHALELLRDAITEFQISLPTQLPSLWLRLCRDIARRPLQERRPRSNPRVVKRKLSKFLLKRPQHFHTPKPSMPFSQAIVLI